MLEPNSEGQITTKCMSRVLPFGKRESSVGAAQVSPNWSLETMTCHSSHCFSIVWGQGNAPLVTSLPRTMRYLLPTPIFKPGNLRCVKFDSMLCRFSPTKGVKGDPRGL